MAIISVDEFKQHDAERIPVVIPGTDKTILCRAIDPLSLVFNGQLKKAEIEPAIPIMAAWAGKSAGDVLKSFSDHADVLAPVIDAIVCAGAVEPRITRERPAESDTSAIWIHDLRLASKAAILFGVTAQLADEVPAAAPTQTRERARRVRQSTKGPKKTRARQARVVETEPDPLGAPTP